MSYINKEKLIECMEAERERWKQEDIEYIKSFPVSDVAPVVRGHWVEDAGGWAYVNETNIYGDAE